VPELAPRSVGILAEISRGETQMLRNQVRRDLGFARARRKVPIGYQSIDVLSSQPCILNGIGSRLQTEAERCSARDPPLRRVAYSCDSELFFQTHQILHARGFIIFLYREISIYSQEHFINQTKRKSSSIMKRRLDLDGAWLIFTIDVPKPPDHDPFAWMRRFRLLG